MSHFRQDIVSKHWVLFAPSRLKRPDDFPSGPATRTDLPEQLETCAFCPMNEHLNPETIAQYPRGADWQVRVIPNKFEALGHTIEPYKKDFYISRPGIGDHEVVITRAHNVPAALQSQELVEMTLKVYQLRVMELEKHEEVRYVHIIQNHGPQAGASLEHPHSQIFATPFVPFHLHEEIVGTCHYFHSHGACVYDEMLLRELQDKKRIVVETDDYLVFCPFAARVPFALRILPKQHRARFQDVPEAEIRSLAKTLREILHRLYKKLNNPPYNYYIHTLPFTQVQPLCYDAKAYHWHLEILPRLNVWGGFELGSEVYVNPMLPESAAEFLRQ